VYVLPNHYAYGDRVDYLHILGEVHNGTGDHIRYVHIAADVYGSSGQFLTDDSTVIRLNSLPAGTSTCFQILLEEPAGWSSYEFEPPAYSTGGSVPPNLTFVEDSGSYDPAYGWYKITGTLRNDHGSRVEYAKIVGTLYDAANRVVGCGFYYGPSLEPGEEKTFTMSFYSRDYADVSRYRLQADGRPQ
jgi:hypothetical protein